MVDKKQGVPVKHKRLTDEELHWIKATFCGNEAGLVTLRKIFLQSGELDTPVGFYKDSWSGVDLKGLSDNAMVLAVASHQSMLGQTEAALYSIKTIAGEETETPEEMAQRLELDSTK